MAASTYPHPNTLSGACQRDDKGSLSSKGWLPLPLEYLDHLRHHHGLSLVEQDVFLYILRRTWGFGKRSDYIALSQFTDGVVRHDGTVIDHGCATRRRATVLAALTHLENCGLVSVVAGRGRRPSHITVLLEVPCGLQLADGPAQPASDTATSERVASGSLYSDSGTPAPRAAVLPANRQESVQVTRKIHSDGDHTHTTEPLSECGQMSATPALKAQQAAETLGLNHHVAQRFAARHDAAYMLQVVDFVSQRSREQGIEQPAAYLYRLLDQPGPILFSATTPRPAREQQRQVSSGRHTQHVNPPTAQASTPCATDHFGTPGQTHTFRPAGCESSADWETILADLRLSMMQDNYERWLACTRVEGVSGKSLRVAVADTFTREWLAGKLARRIEQSIGRMRQQGLLRAAFESVEFTVAHSVTPCASVFIGGQTHRTGAVGVATPT